MRWASAIAVLSLVAARAGSSGAEPAADAPRVHTLADRVQPARMIRGYGRFYHEAAVVDPDTMIAYLTEDRDDSAFYRFVPDRPEEPFVGRLQALRVVGHDRLDTSVSMRPGEVAVVD